MSIKEIEMFTGLKTYPMVANRKENRNKMIRIIADVLDISTETSPLLKDLFKTTDLTYETLLVIKEKNCSDEDTIVEEASLNDVQTEIIKTEKNIREKIDQIVSKNYENKKIKFTKEKVKKEEVKIPIKNALITSELYYGIIKEQLLFIQ